MYLAQLDVNIAQAKEMLMCTPPAFAAGDTTELHEIVRQIWAANFLSANQTVSGQLPLPMFLAEADGERAIKAQR